MKALPECQFILDKLKNELPPKLEYHTIDHTLDVYHSAAYIAKKEAISSSDLKLLLVGAVYHDSGFLIQNDNHEQISCEIAQKYLPNYGYSESDIKVICGLIKATKIPQTPKNHLEQIICDADLHYLGRADFFTIGERLYHEMKALGYLNNRLEWNQLQLQFLDKHQFFTKTVIEENLAQKNINMKIVASKINIDQ